MFSYLDLKSNLTTLGGKLIDLDVQARLATTIPGSVLTNTYTANSMTLTGRIGNGPQVVLTDQHIRSFCRFWGHGKSYTPNQYRLVKQNLHWQALYHHQQNYPFPTIDKQGVAGTSHEEAAPCVGCNVLMPYRCLTVDHQRPQVGGDLLAVMRVFRALGLTVGGPQGRKGLSALQNHAASVGGVQPAPNGQAVQKNQLNIQGQMYFTLLREDDDVWANVKTQAMHHYVNLRPMCGPCNSQLGNQNAGYF